MRGIVYRLARRRAVSVLVAIAATVTVALGATAPVAGAAAAKKPAPIAHVTGHKIA